MATGIKINFNGEKKDIEEICALRRDSEGSLIISESDQANILQQGPGLTPINSFYRPLTYGALPNKVDLSNLIKNINILDIAEIGYSPRFNTTTGIHWAKYIAGSTTRRYYFLYRTETNLHIAQSPSLAGPYTPLETISISFFPQNRIPKMCYFELVGAGGGGNAGYYSNQVMGGGGGAVLYNWCPIRTVDSAPISSPNSEDHIFSIYKGGSGGAPTHNGTGGSSSYVYKNSSIISTAGAGGGGMVPFTYGPAGVPSGDYFYAIPGKIANGGNITFNHIMKEELVSWSSLGGPGYGNSPQGGGGASRANGGCVRTDGNVVSANAFSPGGGGGGGDYYYGNGGNGGNGGLTFFY